MGEVVELRDSITLAECKRRGLPIVWTDPAGTVHACTGAYVHDMAVVWTLCWRDVPAGEAGTPRGEAVDCPDCLGAVAYPEREEGLKTLPSKLRRWKAP